MHKVFQYVQITSIQVTGS